MGKEKILKVLCEKLAEFAPY